MYAVKLQKCINDNDDDDNHDNNRLGAEKTDFKNKTYEMVHKKFNDILSINSSVNTSNSFGSLVGLDLPNGEDPLLASESCQRC